MYAELKRALAAGILLCGVAPLALGAPAISGVSGTLSSGQTVTISGSGFGTKPQAAPLLWDDFEQGTAGKLVAGNSASVGSWDTGGGTESVTYSSSKAYAGGKAAFHDLISNYNASLAKNLSFSRLYMDFWILTDYVDRVSRNWKPWRFYGDNDALQLSYVFLCNGQLIQREQATLGWSQGDWGGNTYSKNQWMHVQLVYSASSPGSADGTIRHFINSSAHGQNSGAVMTRMNSANFNQIRIGHYWAKDGADACSSNGGARVYTDNVYIDTSWARVELGNASTYAASTQREIQVPTTWNDGSVGVKINTGKFAPGTTAYLFVTDSNNNTSAGRQVTVGGSAVAPNPPSSVSVQ
jgi:hypothetical protein